MKDTIVIVPTSRLVASELQPDVGRVPPVLIPVHGKPLLHWMVDSYKNLPAMPKIFLLTHEGEDSIARYLAQAGDCTSVKLLHIPLVDEVGHAILAGLEQIALGEQTECFIHFGDTLVEGDLEGDNDALFYDVLPDAFRWTTFTAENSQLATITDRFSVDNVGEHRVFCGLFYLRSPQAFREALKTPIGGAIREHFYAALLKYAKDHRIDLVRAQTWYDFGHLDNYCRARRAFLNSRHFNQIEIDAVRAIITKRTTAAKKLTDEIQWYLNLPSALRCYAPQIFSYSLDAHNPHVSFEYYGYPTLAERFLGDGQEIGAWERIIDRVLLFIGDASAYRAPLDERARSQSLNSMYLEKTLERLGRVRNEPWVGSAFATSLTVNGEPCRPLLQLLEILPTVLERRGIYTAEPFQIIHGDLCLSNILYDARSSILKVVDPRGDFGGCGSFGDVRYELAKLWQCFHGGYEHITHDRFTLRADQTAIDFSFSMTEAQRCARDIFRRKVTAQFPKVFPVVEIIEALLFLSMIPLHADTPNRQRVMFAQGVSLLDKCSRADC